ncbi:MAG: PqqD family protein [Alphaproteobacteria bacterium]|nr:PqqD family protein [Alphaproteobacteria bacterium]
MSPLDPEALYQRAPGVEFRETEGEVFLVGLDGESLFHLNLVGSALWRLLEEPISAHEAAEILGEAFAGVKPSRIKADTLALFKQLQKRGLIVREG